jgi:hypothetical protein
MRLVYDMIEEMAAAFDEDKELKLRNFGTF